MLSLILLLILLLLARRLSLPLSAIDVHVHSQLLTSLRVHNPFFQRVVLILRSVFKGLSCEAEFRRVDDVSVERT